MTIVTHLASASTPVTGAGCHPLSDWLAEQSNEVRGAHSYRHQIHQIVEGYRNEARLFPPEGLTVEQADEASQVAAFFAGAFVEDPLSQDEIDEVNEALSDLGINDEV